MTIDNWPHKVSGKGDPRLPKKDCETYQVLQFMLTGGVLGDENIDQFLTPRSTAGVTPEKWIRQIAKSWGWNFAGNENGEWILVRD